MILFLVFLAICIYCFVTAEPEKPPTVPPVTMYDVKQAERERKEDAKKKQAAEDIEHLKENLGLLYPLLDAAKAKYEASTDDKEIERLAKKIISLQNQIHAAESKIEKANNIIKYGT